VNIDSLEGGHRDYSVVCEGTWCGLDRNDDGAFWRVRAMIREVDGVERFVVYVPRSRLRIRKPVRWWVFSDAGTMESSDTAPNDGRYLL
jgi:hypothetical protein